MVELTESVAEVQAVDITEAEHDELEQLRRHRLHRLMGQTAVNKVARLEHEFDTPGFDPISSARRYLLDKNEENFQAVWADAETSLLEAMATRSVELYPTYTSRWNGEEFVIGGQTIEGVAANGMQGDVRTNAEYLEAVTPAELVKMDLDQDYGMLTVSTQHEQHHAPVTMLRYSEVSRDVDGIYLQTQQMSIPNQTHSPELIEGFFDSFGANYDNQRDSVEQTLLVRRNDGEQHSVDQFGERLEDLSTAADMFYQKTDYQQLRAQAGHRRRLIQAAADELMAETIRLAKESRHPVVAAAELDDMVDDEGQVRLGLRSQILLKHLRDEPDVADMVFGEATGSNLRLAQATDNKQAKKKFIQLAAANAKETQVCTAGSCGIEAVGGAEAARVRSITGMNGEVMSYAKATCGECGKTGEVRYLRNDSGDYACCLNCESTKKL